jgi:hypothetical protein
MYPPRTPSFTNKCHEYPLPQFIPTALVFLASDALSDMLGRAFALDAG